MKNEKRGKLNRWLLACMMIVLAMALCGCRTRLTNNTEVSDSIEDENGWMMEYYQSRRDEIGSPVAKKPFINGEGDQENEYEGEIYGEYQEEVIDDEEDKDEEEDDDTETETETVSTSTGTSSTGTSSSSTTTTRRSSTTTRKTTSTTKKSSTTTKKTTTTKVTVTFNANGGTISSGSSQVKTSSKSYEVGSPIGSFPSAVWEGHVLLGWYSAATDGIQVDTATIVNEKATIYAHWDPPTEIKEYNIAWNLNGATTEDTMPTKGTTLPKPLPVVKKKGYHFNGWVDENNSNQPVSAGQPVTADMKLKADLVSWDELWNERAKGANKIYIVDGVSDDFVRGKNKEKPEEIPEYVIVCVSNEDFANAKDKADEEAKKYPSTTTIIVIPKAATEGDNAIYYKMLLLDLMYGSDGKHVFSEDEFSSAYKDTEATINIKDNTPYTTQGTKELENSGEGNTDNPDEGNVDNPDKGNADDQDRGNADDQDRGNADNPDVDSADNQDRSNADNSGAGAENGGTVSDVGGDEQPEQDQSGEVEQTP